MKTMDRPSVETVTFDELLEKNGKIVYTNAGFSMLPLLRQYKDIIEITRKESGRCKKYDVVLYKRGSKYILHRILKVLPNGGYLIAGDNTRYIERDIKDENILGVMTRIQRNGKEITPDNQWYKLYVHIWCAPYPLRILLLRARALIRQCGRIIKTRVLKL